MMMYAKNGLKLTADEEYTLRELAIEYKKRGYFTGMSIEEIIQKLAEKHHLYK